MAHADPMNGREGAAYGSSTDESGAMDSVIEENMQLKVEVTKLRKRLAAQATIEADLVAAKTEVESLKAQLSSSAAKVDHLNNLIDDHFKELPELRIEMDELRRQLSVKEQEYDGKQADCEDLQNEVADLAHKITVLEPECAQVKPLTEELERLRNSAAGSSGLKNELHLKSQQLAELEAAYRNVSESSKGVEQRSENMTEELAVRCSRWQQALTKARMMRVDLLPLNSPSQLMQQAENAKMDLDKVKQTLLRDKKDEKVVSKLGQAADFFKLATDALIATCEITIRCNDLVMQLLAAGLKPNFGTGAGGVAGGAPGGSGSTPSKEQPPATPRGSWINLNRGST